MRTFWRWLWQITLTIRWPKREETDYDLSGSPSERGLW